MGLGKAQRSPRNPKALDQRKREGMNVWGFAETIAENGRGRAPMRKQCSALCRGAQPRRLRWEQLFQGEM